MARSAEEGWMHPDLAIADGTQCDLMLRDPLGAYQATGVYFLHDDREWYRIEPPLKLSATVIAWRPTRRPALRERE